MVHSVRLHDEKGKRQLQLGKLSLRMKNLNAFLNQVHANEINPNDIQTEDLGNNKLRLHFQIKNKDLTIEYYVFVIPRDAFMLLADLMNKKADEIRSSFQ